MSTLGDPDARRVTRSQSRQASSRGNSIEPASRAASIAPSPAPSSQAATRRSQRNAAREAADVDEPELNPRSKKVGNKSNSSYGTRGKRNNAQQMSANTATDNTATQLEGSIDYHAMLPTTGEAGRLPVVNEEGESVLATVENQAHGGPGGQLTSNVQGSVPPLSTGQKSPAPVLPKAGASGRSREGSSRSNRGQPATSNGEGPISGGPAGAHADGHEASGRSREGSTHSNRGGPIVNNGEGPGSGGPADAHANGRDIPMRPGLSKALYLLDWVKQQHSILLPGRADAEPELRSDQEDIWRDVGTSDRARLERIAEMEEMRHEAIQQMRWGDHIRGAARQVWSTLHAFYIAMMIVSFTVLLFLVFDAWIGPLLGPRFDIGGFRSLMVPHNNDSILVAETHIRRRFNMLQSRSQARLDSLEHLIYQLTSPSQTSPLPKPVHQVNWFAAANGAVVDPYLSSPVDLICRGIREHTWYTKLLSITGKCEPASYPPGQALRPWSEPDERWCAPPGRGKLQLAVLISRPVAPTDLIIEHMPKDASLFIGDAPKELELWVDIPDDEVNARVREAVAHMFPDFLFPSSPQKDRELDEKQTLPTTFIPVGRWIYNIYEDHPVQKFHIPIPLKDFGVRATRFAVRVNSNWGDYGATCMYRAILHGQDVSGIVEDLEIDPRMEPAEADIDPGKELVVA